MSIYLVILCLYGNVYVADGTQSEVKYPNMHYLTQELRAAGERGLQKLVDDRQQEGVDLEFKRKRNARVGAADDDDKNALGAIVSAFSNSMGGLVIWGIEGAKDPETGIDCAISLEPIEDIEKFESDMKRLASHAVMPRAESIVIESIRTEASAKKGYLLIDIERSERRPHCSEFGKKEYYKRITDNSIPMEHYDIEDAFKRLVSPKLDVQWSVRSGGSQSIQGGTSYDVMIDIAITNTSNMSARFPYLIIRGHGRSVVADVSRDFIQRREKEGLHLVGSADMALHPEMTFQCASLRVDFPTEVRDRVAYLPDDILADLTVSYSCGALHSRPVNREFIVPAETLWNALPPGIKIAPKPWPQ